MLHHTGVEARSLALDPPSVGRKTMVADAVVPRNQAAQPGYRETSLKSEADAVAHGLDHRVDQGGRRFRDLWLPLFPAVHRHAADDQPARDMDLGRRQPDAGRSIHGLDHVRDPAVQFRDRWEARRGGETWGRT